MSSPSPLFVILAGGEGKRFAPLVTNKTIFPFFGKPLLQHQLEQLKRVGINNILIATNDENETWLQKFSLPGLTIRAKVQPRPLGMVDAMLHLAPEIGEQPIVVMNAVDVVDDQLYIELLTYIEKQPYGLITGMKVSSYFQGGYLKTENGRVTAVIEKPGPGNEPSDLVNLVFHYFSKPQEFISILRELPSNPDSDDGYEQALSKLMQTNEFNVVSYDGYWQKLKFPHFVLDMTELFLKNLLKPGVVQTAKISPHAIVEGPVFIGENAVIEAGAIIKGPVYIGNNTIVGNHTLVRQSIVENDCIVGFGSEVARSYIGPFTKLHHNFVGDSVLEGGNNPSFGTVTTNMRLDFGPVKLKTISGEIETNRSKLGVIMAKEAMSGSNCVYLPGVTLGEKAMIYPGTIVHHAVPAHTTLKYYQEQKSDSR